VKWSRCFRLDLALGRLGASRPRRALVRITPAQKQRALDLIERIKALDRQPPSPRKEN